MNQRTVAHLDAISFLERVKDASATLVYFDPPVGTGQDATDLQQLRSLYLHATCHSKRILKDTGVLVWHTLPEMASDVRRSLDRVFGPQLFATEIVLKRRLRQRATQAPITDHTSLIIYSKTGEFYYNPPKHPISERTRLMYAQSDENGPYKLVDITAPVNRPNLQFPWHNHLPPAGRSWRYSLSRLEELHSDGRIQVSESMFPRQKAYLSDHADEEIGSVWDDIDLPAAEHVQGDWEGQQSLLLLSRIITMLTQEDDLVVDPFCGTGTGLIAAEQLKRNWVAGDNSLSSCGQAVSRLKENAGCDCILLGANEARQFPILRTVTDIIRALPPLTDSIPIDTHELLAALESKTLEFKQTLSLDVKSTDKQKQNEMRKVIELATLKTIAAFLNSDGGTLLVGVTDSRDPVGIEDDLSRFHDGSHDKFLLHFKNLIRANIGEQFYPFLDSHLVPIDTKWILRVDCKRSDRPCFIGDDFYVRTNPATDKLAGPTLLQYVSTRFPNFGA